MADKITNFEDYKKKESTNNDNEKKKDFSETTEINNIEIMDPYNFFNEEEREEYFKQRQKEESKEKKAEKKEKEAENKEKKAKRKPQEKPIKAKPEEEPYEEDFDEEDAEDIDEDEEDEEDEDSSSVITPELLVRIASVLTGIVILAFIAFVVKAKVIDKYLLDPDTTEVTTQAIPSGYTQTDDTVVVTAESLNLRTVPSTDSDTYIAEKVNKGTQLKRIAVSDDGTWALVEYGDRQLYGYMKYLSAP